MYQFYIGSQELQHRTTSKFLCCTNHIRSINKTFSPNEIKNESFNAHASRENLNFCDLRCSSCRVSILSGRRINLQKVCSSFAVPILGCRESSILIYFPGSFIPPHNLSGKHFSDVILFPRSWEDLASGAEFCWKRPVYLLDGLFLFHASMLHSSLWQKGVKYSKRRWPNLTNVWRKSKLTRFKHFSRHDYVCDIHSQHKRLHNVIPFAPRVTSIQLRETVLTSPIPGSPHQQPNDDEQFAHNWKTIKTPLQTQSSMVANNPLASNWV